MLIIAQKVHQDLHPDDVLASEDELNAYNNAKKDKIALGMLESDYEEIRGLHRYFLRAHKRPTNIDIAGHRMAMIKGKKGVKQGDPFAGAEYSMGQHHMLLELFFDAKSRRKLVWIGAIVGDIAIQAPASHVAYGHQWLKDRGPEWGYYLNEKPGKSTYSSRAPLQTEGRHRQQCRQRSRGPTTPEPARDQVVRYAGFHVQGNEAQCQSKRRQRSGRRS